MTDLEIPDLLAGYRAGREGTALRDETSHGRLWLAGEHRFDFLQRLTTNDVRLQPSQGTVTILTSPTARIVVLFTVLAKENGLLLLAGPAEGPKAYNSLRSQIFFGDLVTVEGKGQAMCQFGLYGPQTSHTLAAAGAGDLDTLPLFAWQEVAIAGQQVTVQRNEGLGAPGFTLLSRATQQSILFSALVEAGATPLSEKAFHVLRVEAGVPAPNAELTDQVNPLEVGLRRFCNDHKGCYTGQEIIARQITYDKATTHLVGLLLENSTTPGATVTLGGRRIGSVSSAVHSIALGRPIALALVRQPHDKPGTTVYVASDAEASVAEVARLPFDVP
jgi:folate-binding protein YgfZ